MNEEQILQLAEVIRNGKATNEERLTFVHAINANLEETLRLLAKMPQKKN